MNRYLRITTSPGCSSTGRSALARKLICEGYGESADLRAAIQGITAANSQHALARANSKQDVTVSPIIRMSTYQRIDFLRQRSDSDLRPQSGGNRAHALRDHTSGRAEEGGRCQAMTDVRTL